LHKDWEQPLRRIVMDFLPTAWNSYQQSFIRI